ncbi:MAG: ABC transporter ATP-binding protein [Gammaproteobacteria bacterium]|nr:ABC transporter ATP-binding protein [Gammaproteobacteria bacterium]
MDAVLALNNVGVCYRRRAGIFRSKPFWAVRDATFELRRGETLGIIGGNGAGKSTILRVIAGIIQPDKGVLSKPGDYSASLLALQVGFVPHLTARENIFLSGMILGLSRRELAERFDAIVAFSDLGEFIDEPIRTYSVGMRARLGFAISIQADPDILLVDEVLGVGDAAFREKSGAAMREKIESNKTVVLVSHQAASIREFCNRVVWIERGATIAIGAPAEILKRYQQQVTAKRTPAAPAPG